MKLIISPNTFVLLAIALKLEVYRYEFRNTACWHGIAFNMPLFINKAYRKS